MSKRHIILVVVCLVSIAAVMQGCGVGLLATLGAASSGSSGGSGGNNGPSTAPSAVWISVKEVKATSIYIEWTDAGDESGYTIERKIGIGGTYSEIANVPANTPGLVHKDLIPGTTYYYRVKAYNSIGSTYSSNEVNATTIKVQPDSLIKKVGESDTDYIAEAVYNSDAAGQTKIGFIPKTQTASYYIKVENDCDTGVQDTFKITATKTSGPGWTVAVYAGATPITTEVFGTGWNTSTLNKDQFVELRLDVTPDAGVTIGAACTVTVTAASNTASVVKDVVKAITEAVDQPITRLVGGVWSEYSGYSNIATGPGNSHYICGYTSSYGSGGDDAIVIGYDNNGALIMEKVWGGANWEDAYAIAADQSGNIYLGGTTNTWKGDGDAFILKYDSSGALQWQRSWGNNGYECVYGIAIDPTGNDIYICGYTNSSSTDDAFLLKYDSNGVFQWDQIWNSSGYEYAYGITVDATGNNIYLCGRTDKWGSGDVLLLKYLNDGTLDWQKTWGGNGWDTAYGITTDSAGNIYIVGNINPGTGDDIFLIRVKNDGSLDWKKTWGGNMMESGYGVAVDSQGNVYVCGTTWSFGGTGDGFLLKYDNTGALVSQKTYGTTTNMEEFRGVAVDANNVYLGGTASNTNGTFQSQSGTTSTPNISLVDRLAFSSGGALFPEYPIPGIEGTPNNTGGGQDLLLLRRPKGE